MAKRTQKVTYEQLYNAALETTNKLTEQRGEAYAKGYILSFFASKLTETLAYHLPKGALEAIIEDLATRHNDI